MSSFLPAFDAQILHVDAGSSQLVEKLTQVVHSVKVQAYPSHSSLAMASVIKSTVVGVF